MTVSNPAMARLFDEAVAAPYRDEAAPPTNGKPGHGTNERVKARFATINGFVDLSMRTVKPTDVAVWLVLWRETKPNGVATISHVQIAHAVGVHARTVGRSLERLRKGGLIVVARRGGIGRGASTYQVRAAPS